MSAIYEYTGVVEKLMPLQTIGEKGFRKRELILTEDEDSMSNFPNHIPFTFKQDRVSLIENLSEGQRVKVRFAIEGRVWHSPKTNEDVYFKDLVGLKVDTLSGENTPTQAAPQAASTSDIPSDFANSEDINLPF
jgi:hypothetical protein